MNSNSNRDPANDDASEQEVSSVEPTCLTYRISWFVQVEAESAHAAASVARAIQRDEEGIATIFTVQSPDGSALCIDVENGQELPSDYSETSPA